MGYHIHVSLSKKLTTISCALKINYKYQEICDIDKYIYSYKHNSIMNYHVHVHVIIHLTVKRCTCTCTHAKYVAKTMNTLVTSHVYMYYNFSPQRVVPWYSSLCRNTVLPKHHVPLMTSNTINILSWTGENIVPHNDTTKWMLNTPGCMYTCTYIYTCTFTIQCYNKMDIKYSSIMYTVTCTVLQSNE